MYYCWCSPEERKTYIWDGMRVRKWLDNFHFWLKYLFKRKLNFVGTVMFELLNETSAACWTVRGASFPQVSVVVEWRHHPDESRREEFNEKRTQTNERERERDGKEVLWKGRSPPIAILFFSFCLFVIKIKEFKLQTDIKACQYIHAHHCSSNKDITCETKTSIESVWVTSALLPYANMLIYRWYGVTWEGQIQYHVQMDLEDMSSHYIKFRLVVSQNLFWQCSLKWM